MRLFLSHTWRPDELGRNTHERVRILRDWMHIHCIGTWFDEDHMVDDVDACMASGIQSSDVVCVFLTKSYCSKVSGAARNCWMRDNCYKEFAYSQIMCKPIIPIVFEPCMRDVARWPNGVVKLYLGNKLYVDGSGEDLHTVALSIVRMARKHVRGERVRTRCVPVRVAPVYVRENADNNDVVDVQHARRLPFRYRLARLLGG